jgi:hypothetical protein
MFLRARSRLLTYRGFAMLMTLALLVAGQGVHVPAAQADADAGTTYAMSGHSPAEHGLNAGDGKPSGGGVQSQLDCAGSECGGCVASMPSSTLGPPPLHELPSDHAVINSAVRPPERLFRPPIRLS